MMGLTLLVVGVAFVAAVHSAVLPTVPNCQDQTEYWKGGSSYRYIYTANIDSRADLSTDRLTGTQIKCKVHLAALGQCRYIIKTPDCELSERATGSNDLQRHSQTDELKEQMARYPVTFLMSHGEVHNLIVNDNEPVAILNIKRGIISTLQGSRDKYDDDEELRTDVHGTCPVHYEVSEETVKVKKDMNRCSHPSRLDWELSPSSLIWNMSFLQMWVINAKSQCEHTLTAEALQKSACTERHAFRYNPVTKNARAQTVATQTLELRNTQADSSTFDRNLNGKRLTEIQYEYEEMPTPTQPIADFSELANRIIENMVSTTLEELKPNTYEQFDELVALFRQSPEVKTYVQGMWSCGVGIDCAEMNVELARAYVRDALVTCNKEQCMEAISWLAVNDYLSNSYLNNLLYKFTKLKVTKPGYLNAVSDICKAKPTRTCLLSLTSMIHSYTLRNPDQVANNPPRAIQETVNQLLKNLDDGCSSDDIETPFEDKVEKYILALKSIGNLGDIALQRSNDLFEKIRTCINNNENPQNVSIEAIKSLRRVAANQQIYSALMTIIRNPKETAEHRIISYLVLTQGYQEEKLYNDLAGIIKSEPDDQLGNFVTMHMNNILTYGDASLNRLKISIRKALATHEDVFILRGTRPLVSSRHREVAGYYVSPLLHDLINQFGIDISSTAIYETYSFLPQHLILNLTTQIFGRTLNSATISAALHGLDPWLEFFFGFRTNGNLNTLGERFKALQENDYGLEKFLRSNDWTPHFDSDVERKLTGIHNSVIHDYAKDAPAGSFSLKRYGDELAYTSLGLIKARVTTFFQEELGAFQWQEKHAYRAHRLIRFIEGYNQIPLLSGLPLKWKTTATFAFSFRIEGMIDPFSLINDPPAFTTEWELNPSGSITVHNQMYVKVSTFLKFGVQDTTTIYRSREHGGKITYLDGDFNLVWKVPQRPQQILTVIHVNKLIRNDALEPIADYNVQRVETENCHADQLTGLKYCHFKSYGSSADRIPLDLFASNTEYRVWVELADPGLKQYNLQIKRLSPAGSTSPSYLFHFIGPGDNWRREIQGRCNHDHETGEFNAQLLVPEKPEYKIEVSRQRIEGGYQTDIDASFGENRPFVFHGKRVAKQEQRTDSNGRPVAAKVKVVVARIQLHDRTYNLNHMYQKYGEEYQSDTNLNYETSASETFLRKILPDIFWESSTKASAQVHSQLKKKEVGEGFECTVTSFIKLPKSILEFNTERVSRDDERKLGLYITRRQLPSNNVESFINASYHMERTNTGNKSERSHIIQLLIPKLRWSLEIKQEIDPVDYKDLVTLKREKTTDGSIEVTESSSLDTWYTTLKIDYHNESRARNDHYPTPRERDVEVVLDYPRDNSRQTVSYKVKIINDEGEKNASVSFNTDSTLESSYLQLMLKGKMKHIRTVKDIKFDYTAFIKNKRTGNEANYNLHFDYNYNLPLVLTQNYQSVRYTYNQTLNVQKVADGIDGDLQIHARCPEWDFLDVDLNQQFHFNPDNSWEKMEFKHKWLDIDVKGEFRLPFGSFYKKEFNIKSKNSIIPTMNWILDFYDYTHYNARIEYPNEHRNIYSLLELSPDHKGAVYTIAHDHNDEPRIEVVNWTIRIVNPNVVVGNFITDCNAIRAAAKVYAERLKNTWEAWVRIKNDPNHPMNKFLRPLVKTTLADFQREIEEDIHQRGIALRTAIKEAVLSLEPIYGPTVAIVRNILLVIEKGFTFATYQRDEESYIVRLWDGLQLNDKIKQYFQGLVQRFTTWYNPVISTDSRTRTVTINHPFHWEYITELPRPTPKFYRLINNIRNGYSSIFAPTRDAILYGFGNIYTFDGKAYQFPAFPNEDCMYLLAHNFAARKFSLLGQKSKLHLLLPEASITYDIDSGVKLNNQATSLPITENYYKVTRHSGLINIETEYGINLKINPADRVVVVSMSFWNHNKTLGLLGNNDNQAKNDLKKLNGQITENLPDFLSTYEVSGNAVCSNREQLSRGLRCSETPDYSCNRIFNEGNIRSPLYMCFDVVNPNSFREACLRDTSCGGKQCSSILAYTAVCKNHNIPLWTSC